MIESSLVVLELPNYDRCVACGTPLNTQGGHGMHSRDVFLNVDGEVFRWSVYAVGRGETRRIKATAKKTVISATS